MLSQNLHTSSIIQTEQVPSTRLGIGRYTYMCIKIINEKKRGHECKKRAGKEYVGKFGWRKGKGE